MDDFGQRMLSALPRLLHPLYLERPARLVAPPHVLIWLQARNPPIHHEDSIHLPGLTVESLG